MPEQSINEENIRTELMAALIAAFPTGHQHLDSLEVKSVIEAVMQPYLDRLLASRLEANKVTVEFEPDIESQAPGKLELKITFPSDFFITTKLPDVIMPIELDEDEILTVFGLNHFRALCRADGFTVVYNQEAGGYHLEQLSFPDSFVGGAVYDCEIDAYEDCCDDATYDRVVEILGSIEQPEVMIVSSEFAVQMAARGGHIGEFKGLSLWYRSKENA